MATGTKILIVDDSVAIRDAVRTALIGAGYATIEAEDGVEGLKKADQNKDIKLIICDVNMPNMDGLTMCAKLREMKDFATTTIFMLTTESNEVLKEKGRKAGIRAWMQKPFNAERMLAGIKKVIGE